MVKGFKRFLVASLVASMVLPTAVGGMSTSAAEAAVSRGTQEEALAAQTDGEDPYAANKTYSFTFDKLEVDAESSKKSGVLDAEYHPNDGSHIGGSISVNQDGSAVLHHELQYGQVFFKLPEGINSRRVTAIEFVGVEENKVGSFSVKVLPKPFDDTLADKNGGVSYGKTVLKISGLEFGYFSAMSLSETEIDFSVSKVNITLGDEPEIETDTEIIKKKLSDLLLVAPETVGQNFTVENNTIVYGGQWQNAFFEIPNTLFPGRISQIEVKGDLAAGLMFKAMTKTQFNDGNERWGNGIATNGNGPSLTFPVNSDLGYLVITCGSNEPYGSISLDTEIELSVEPSMEVQTDIPDLKATVVNSGTNGNDVQGLGANSYVGTCLGGNGIKDAKIAQLVKKHFNAITLENELKPDSLLRGTVSQNDLIVHSNEFGIDVPKSLNFSAPDAMLDTIMEWNKGEDGIAGNADDLNIKVRGHVLTWHSQTPTWFFREGYQEDGKYVSQEVMTKRHEWYIKSVMMHYFGTESNPSKYRNLFYGYDVVNEACSDATGTYRDVQEGTQKSDWAKIYGTGKVDENGKTVDAPDYIINAFRFANKYAPSTLELYYNDYNDCDGSKVPAIVNLLKSVKAHESDAVNPTRITGFGMQGHHGSDSPTKEQILACAKTYGAIVDKVQVTELDVKSSSAYDGTKKTRAAEYTRMGHRYKDIYAAYVEADQFGNAQTGSAKFDVNSFTVWGTIDSMSWLNDAGNVGGASSGGAQCPLLFDGNYQAKPAFWGIVNPKELDPYQNLVDILVSAEDSFAAGKTYSFENEGLKVEFTPVMYGDAIKLRIKVNKAMAAADSVTVYYADADDAVQKIEVKGSEFKNGEAVVKMPGSYKIWDTIKFDIVAIVGETAAIYNDVKYGPETSTKFYAQATCKPYAVIKNGTAIIDGVKGAIWDDVAPIELTINKKADPEMKAQARLLWDDENLYVYMDVKDKVLNKDSVDAYQQDSIEVFIDENNAKSGAYQEDDKQYRINYENEATFSPADSKCNADNLKSAAVKTADGYVIEAAFKWTDIKAAAGAQIGLELQVNDANAEGTRSGTLSWYDAIGQCYENTSLFGTAELNAVKANGVDEIAKPVVDPKKDAPKITEVTKGALKESVDNLITSTKSPADIKGADYLAFKSQTASAGNTDAKISWDKIKDAASYVVYGAENGKNYEKLGETASTSYQAKGLAKGKEYSYVIVAFDKDGKAICVTKTISLVTKGGKYTDVKKIKVSKKKLTLKKGKKAKIKAKIQKVNKKLPLKNKKLTYVSSNKKVATVDKKGKIKAKKKGKCTIYVYAKNGKRAAVKVTVK